MTSFHLADSARIMRAAISRRRALRGLTGAALAFAGRGGVDARGTAPSSVSGYYPGLPRAVLVPSDVPGGDAFGVAAGYSFLGPRGAADRTGLEEQMLAALGDTVASVVGGHITIVSPINPPLNRNISTRLIQFAKLADARDAFDRLASDAFPELEDVTPADERDRFFQGTVERGSATYAQEIVLFRAAEVVAIILISDQTGPAAPEPLPGAPIERLTELRQIVATRLRDATDPAQAGLRRAIPSIPEFAAASEGQLDLAIDAWIETYTQLDGRQIRSRYQSDDAAAAFHDTHPGLIEAIELTNHVPTFGGHTLSMHAIGLRFEDSVAVGVLYRKSAGLARTGDLRTPARVYFDEIEQRAQDQAASNPAFAARSVERPPDAPEALESKWMLTSVTSATIRSDVARVWALQGTDVVSVAIPGPPRSSEEDEDADDVATLFRFASLALAGYTLWSDRAASEEGVLGDLEAIFDGFDSLPRLCDDYDNKFPAE